MGWDLPRLGCPHQFGLPTAWVPPPPPPEIRSSHSGDIPTAQVPQELGCPTSVVSPHLGSPHNLSPCTAWVPHNPGPHTSWVPHDLVYPIVWQTPPPFCPIPCSPWLRQSPRPCCPVLCPLATIRGAPEGHLPGLRAGARGGSHVPFEHIFHQLRQVRAAAALQAGTRCPASARHCRLARARPVSAHPRFVSSPRARCFGAGKGFFGSTSPEVPLRPGGGLATAPYVVYLMVHGSWETGKKQGPVLRGNASLQDGRSHERSSDSSKTFFPCSYE